MPGYVVERHLLSFFTQRRTKPLLSCFPDSQLPDTVRVHVCCHHDVFDLVWMQTCPEPVSSRCESLESHVGPPGVTGAEGSGPTGSAEACGLGAGVSELSAG